jgi:hypothetical protein
LGATAFGGPPVHFKIVSSIVPVLGHCLEFRCISSPAVGQSSSTKDL